MDSDPGYIKITRAKNEIPPRELFEELENYVGRDKFCSTRTATSTFGAVRIDGGSASEKLLHHGVNFSQVSWFQNVLGCSFEEAAQSKPLLLFWAKNETPLPRYPAGPQSRANIYCPAIMEDLHEGNGLFRIVEGSHRMTRAEIDRAQVTSIRLKPNEILIMAANLTIEYPQEAGGVAIWMAVSNPFK